MAHEVTPANSGTGQVHAGDTPVRAVATDGTVTVGDTNHGAHPTVSSITLKGANTRGTMAAVTEDDTATGDVNEAQFTIVIDFDRDVTDAASSTDFTTTVPTIATTVDVCGR